MRCRHRVWLLDTDVGPRKAEGFVRGLDQTDPPGAMARYLRPRIRPPPAWASGLVRSTDAPARAASTGSTGCRRRGGSRTPGPHIHGHSGTSGCAWEVPSPVFLGTPASRCPSSRCPSGQPIFLPTVPFLTVLLDVRTEEAVRSFPDRGARGLGGQQPPATPLRLGAPPGPTARSAAPPGR